MKLWAYTLLVLLAFGIHTAKAEINFIVDSTDNSIKNDKPSKSSTTTTKSQGNQFKQNSIARCRLKGYQRYGCPEGYEAIEPCPENFEMYKYCCAPEYKYTKAQCAEVGLVPSSKPCGGLYSCIKK